MGEVARMMERRREMTLEERGTRTGRGRETLKELLLRGEASWRRKGRGTSLSRLRWVCLKRPTMLESPCLMQDCSTSLRAWTLDSVTTKPMECTTNPGGRRATQPPTSTGQARTLTPRCTAGRRTWRHSGPTRGLSQTRVSKGPRVALVLEAVRELVRSSLRRRPTIRLVWMTSYTRPSRPAATRGRMMMDVRGATIGVARTARGGRSTTKKKNLNFLEELGRHCIDCNFQQCHVATYIHLHHKLQCQYKLGKCQP